MYRNKINFAQPLRPSNRPSPPFETNSFHARGVSVEYEYGGNERPERETIFDRALDVYRHVFIWNAGRNVRFGGTSGRGEKPMCVSNYPEQSGVMTRGVDTLLRFRWTMGDSTETLHPAEGGGIKKGDVLIRQNPILFIGSFDQIAREIVRGLKMDCVWGIVATIFPYSRDAFFWMTFGKKRELRSGESFFHRWNYRP